MLAVKSTAYADRLSSIPGDCMALDSAELHGPAKLIKLPMTFFR
jgi:hypothetical protein